MAATALPKTFNIYLAAESSSTNVLFQMYRGLVSINMLTTEVEPFLARSWMISKDKKQYTLFLHQDLKWSDGHPLTADDVLFTYHKIINNPLIPNMYKDRMLYKGQFPKLEKVDKYTIRFTTPEPFAAFIQTLTNPIVPKHILENSLIANPEGKLPFHQIWNLNSDISQIVSNGPWKLSEYIPGERVVLESNPYYKFKDKDEQQLPYLDKLIFVEVQDQNAELIKFQAQETDSLAMRPDDYDLLRKKKKNLNIDIHNLGPSPSTTFIMFNMSTATNRKNQTIISAAKSKWFNNQYFRQAMAHAIDKEGIIESVYKGRALPQHSHLSQQSPYYKPTVTSYTFNLKKAKELLLSNGFYFNTKQQLLDLNGNQVKLNLTTNIENTQRDATCAIIKKNWEKLGIQVNYRPVAFNTLVEKVHDTLDWEVVLMGSTGNPIEPHFGISRWKLDGRMHIFNMGHKNRWHGKRGTHFKAWEHELERLYEQAAITFDFNQRKKLYWKTQDIIAKHLPFIYTVTPLSMVAVKKSLGNIYPSIYAGKGIKQLNWNSEVHYLEQ